MIKLKVSQKVEQKDKDMNNRREKTGKLGAWSWRSNIWLIQAPEKEIWKDLKRRHKTSSNWKSWLPQWKGSPKRQRTETIPSHSMSIARAKKPPWDRPSEEDQEAVIRTRDLLGETPVKDIVYRKSTQGKIRVLCKIFRSKLAQNVWGIVKEVTVFGGNNGEMWLERKGKIKSVEPHRLS